MNTKTKMDVPDIGRLLGKITDKQSQGELGTTDRQKVVLVSEETQENKKTEKQNNVKSFSQENGKTIKQEIVKTGRKSRRQEGVDYVRIGAVIPKGMRQQLSDALTYEVFKNKKGESIKTVDEIIQLALERLLTGVAKK
jgi:hypothetical protein